jgi:hypothetical protein
MTRVENKLSSQSDSGKVLESPNITPTENPKDDIDMIPLCVSLRQSNSGEGVRVSVRISVLPVVAVIQTCVLGHPEFPVNPKISENLKVIVSLVRTAELEAVGARTKLICL